MIPCHSKLTGEAAMNTRFEYELFSNFSETCSTSLSVPPSPNVPDLCCCEHVGDSAPSTATSTTILDNNNNALFRATHSHRYLDRGSATRRSAMFCCGSLPIILFFVVYFILVCLGGYCFYLLEVPTERSERLRLHAAQVAFLKTHRCVTSKDLFEFLQHVLRATRMNIIATEIRNMSLYDGLDIPSDWSENFDSPSLTELLKRIGKIAGHDLKAEEEVTGNWNIDRAIFFGMTIVTTIGYGKVSPVTLWGKVFCIIFACFGIPATLVFSSVLINICMGPIRKNRDQLVRRFCRGPGIWQKNSDTRTYSHTLSMDHSAEPNLPMDPPGVPIILPPCELNTYRTTHHAVHFEHHPPNRAEVNERPPTGPRNSGSMKYRPK
ncbi:potassium channel subfamily K member 10 [Clonorchis sinensis]|uniref:Potassium channel subfamily K member 10 n=1 Tax=Clonorchis sinensis TaxID=79923 RepID=G7YB10_CLOSI|nr:potassium channel subfamily K member 10 [Clonorchis sinensis]